MEKKYVTINELMAILKVKSRSTINNWRKEGMPYEKFGKLVRFDETEVMEWLKKQNDLHKK